MNDPRLAMSHRTHRARAVAAFALAILALMLLPTPAQAQVLPVHLAQKVDVHGDARRTLTYRMVAADPTAPMPEGSEDGVFEWQMTGTTSSDLNVSYDTPASEDAVYHYTFAQVPGKEAGIEYDDTVYDMEVRVYAEPIERPNGTTNVLATVTRAGDSEKIAEPSWVVRSVTLPVTGGDTSGTTTGGWGTSAGSGSAGDSRLPKTSDLVAGLGMLALGTAGCGAFLLLAGLGQREEDEKHD